MPNWVSNKLAVSGDNKMILQNFIDSVKDGDSPFSLNSLVPMPKGYLDTGAWYNWSWEHWGTKWDVNAYIISQSDTTVVFGFDSAGSPIKEWVTSVSEIFPTLSFELKFKDGSSGFRGEYIICDSVVEMDDIEFYVPRIDEEDEEW